MHKILVANRGEIAVRIIHTCRKMNIRSVAIFSDEDRNALHVQHADEAIHVGAAPVEKSYLNAERVLDAARRCQADGLHPGYGFLSEDAAFASAVEDAGIVWIGPPPAAMEVMSSKIRARDIAAQHQVPVVPGITLAADAKDPNHEAIENLGFPLLLKASAGGGGIGMREVHEASELEQAITQGRVQAQRQFGDSALLIERLVCGARHVEVQLAGDRHGKLLHLYERDCSMQRRRQKLIEEAPAPGLSDKLRGQLHDAALRLGAAVGYHGVGTVEFLVQDEEFFMLEMNTRLQVEHGVTEAICGLDLVQMQIEIARGLPLNIDQQAVRSDGHAIEARIYAEQPAAGFSPSVGTITAFHSAHAGPLRVDAGVGVGSRVSQHYDGLLCKLIVSDRDRESATNRLLSALRELCIAGVSTNQRFLQSLLSSASWQCGGSATAIVEQHLENYLEQSEPGGDELKLALMAATVWQFRTKPPAADLVPWPGGYQLQRQTLWTLDDQHHHVSWRWASSDSYHFAEYDSVARVSATTGGPESLALEIDGLRREFQCHETVGGVCIWTAEYGALTLQLERSAGRVNDAQDQGHCVSAGPGQVLRILVEAGQSVNAGEALLVVESMKMETTLTSRQAGTVSSIETETGALVETDQLLVCIETHAEVAR